MTNHNKFDVAFDTLDVDGYVDDKGVRYVGTARRQADGKWLALASIAGSLCVVECSVKAGVPAVVASTTAPVAAPLSAETLDEGVALAAKATKGSYEIVTVNPWQASIYGADGGIEIGELPTADAQYLLWLLTHARALIAVAKAYNDIKRQ